MKFFQKQRLQNNQYELIKILGTGTQAEAWLANDLLLEIQVVLRIGKSPESLATFKSQFKSLTSVSLPSLVTALGFFLEISSQHPVIAMERVTGKTLGQWAPGTTIKQRVAALQSTAEALEALHKAGLFHGDVNSGNIFVLSERVVLIDPDASGWGSSQGSPANSTTALAFDEGVRQDRDELFGICSRLFNQEEMSRLGLSEFTTTGSKQISELIFLIKMTQARPDLVGSGGNRASQLSAKFSDRIGHEVQNFLHIQKARSQGIESLFGLFSDYVNEFTKNGPPTIKYTRGAGDDTRDKQEQASSLAGQSTLFNRSIEVETVDKAVLQILFGSAALPSFTRPWPNLKGVSPSVIERGRLTITMQGQELVTLTIDIHLNDGFVPKLLSPTSKTTNTEIDTAWIERIMAILTRERTPAIDSPEQIRRAEDDCNIARKPIDRGILEHTILGILNAKNMQGASGEMPSLRDHWSVPQNEKLQFIHLFIQKTMKPHLEKWVDCFEYFDFWSTTLPNGLDVEMAIWSCGVRYCLSFRTDADGARSISR